MSQTIVLTSDRDYDMIVAEEVSIAACKQGRNIKDHLTQLRHFALCLRRKAAEQLGFWRRSLMCGAKTCSF